MEYGNTGFYGFHGHGHSNDLGLPRRTELSEETLVGVAAADLRRWAGINSAYGGMDDDLEKAFLAARTRVAAMTGRAIAEAERIDYYGCWHSTLTLSGRPLDPAAVVVHYLDEGGDEQTVAAADYEVDATARRPAVRFGETPGPHPARRFGQPGEGGLRARRRGRQVAGGRRPGGSNGF